MLLGARTLLGAPGHTIRNKKLLGAPGIATNGSGMLSIWGISCSQRLRGWTQQGPARPLLAASVTEPQIGR